MSITAADIRQRAAEAAHDHTCILRADQVDAIAAIEDAARASALAEVARLRWEAFTLQGGLCCPTPTSIRLVLSGLVDMAGKPPSEHVAKALAQPPEGPDPAFDAAMDEVYRR